MAPKAVRLSFHDCIGGCNGCLDLTNGNNAGLGPIRDLYEELYMVLDNISYLT